MFSVTMRCPAPASTDEPQQAQHQALDHAQRAHAGEAGLAEMHALAQRIAASPACRSGVSARRWITAISKRQAQIGDLAREGR